MKNKISSCAKSVCGNEVNNEMKSTIPSVDKPWMKYYSEEAVNATIPECSMYEYMARENAGRTEAALNYFGRRISYRKLLDDIDSDCGLLQKLGVVRGECIPVFAVNIPECISILYAINKIGAVADMEQLNLSAREMEASLTDINPRIVITVDICLQTLLQAASSIKSIERILVLSIGDSFSGLKRVFYNQKIKLEDTRCILKSCMRGKEIRCIGVPRVFEENAAVIVHSGGTTGKPKEIVLSNRNLNAIAVEYKFSLLGLDKGDSFLNIAPPFIAFGLALAIHVPLCLGLTICLSPSPNPDDTGKIFQYYKPQHFLGGPLHIRSIVEAYEKNSKKMPYLLTCGYGGENISKEDEQRYVSFLRSRGAKIEHLSPGYGMTELGSTVVVDGRNLHRDGSVGVPFALANIRITNPDTGDELGANQEGEIWLTSPSLMVGYLNNEKETDSVIVAIDGQRWIKSGDSGHIDEDGFVYIKRAWSCKRCGRNCCPGRRFGQDTGYGIWEERLQ